MTEITLKRCPFDCDPEVDPTVEPTRHGQFKGFCNWCGAAGPAGATPKEAADLWNERATYVD